MLIDDGINISHNGSIGIANDDVTYDEFILKKSVSSLTSESDTSLNRYSVTFVLLNGRNREIKLSDVTNQVGWTDDASGVTQALADINVWLLDESAQFSGLGKISVGTVTPSSPSVGDLWVDTN